MEKAFTSPHVLSERLDGPFDARTIAGYDPDAFEVIFRQPPALRRFRAPMAGGPPLAGEGAGALVMLDRFDSDAASVWTGATSGADLVRRIGILPGFGEQKAKIFAALLAKQFDVRPNGWREATGDHGVDGSRRSIADVVDADSRKAVRAYKQQVKEAAKSG
ncbi:MAG TPA: HhH-GPD-type base excision DNA repair protein [Jatrophihabitantaceae bacterium]|nr:HhH-GPD-type base excision DNA repair protein [Jatrophihabitantaceae bacterium]